MIAQSLPTAERGLRDWRLIRSVPRRTCVFAVAVFMSLLAGQAAFAVVDPATVIRLDAAEASTAIVGVQVNRRTGLGNYTIRVTNLTAELLTGPVYLSLENIVPPTATAVGNDETFPDGTLLYLIDADIAPGGTADGVISVINRSRTSLDMDIVVWASLPDGAPDLDGDGIPDDQDPDIDGDGVDNDDDAFPRDPNETSDLDGDGVSDNADPDRDGDGVDNGDDAFPDDPNESSDLDGDGVGDNADPDRDGDGVANDVDAFPDDPNESSDLDGDGVGDNADPDRDGDGVANDVDAFPDDPTESSDLDGDGVGDNADPDRDGDGVANGDDAFPDDPSESRDTDGDGVGDNADPDIDGDGVDNGDDPDRDGDGVDNDNDAFPDDPTESSDLDGDGVGDNADPDRDGGGVDNGDDAFPNDPAESSDLDGDGVGDNADPDRDGDGVANDVDAFPDDPAESSDLDGDGVGDNADPDRDGDGVDNDNDAFPNDPAESSDLDGDGVGDNADPDRDGDGVANDVDAFPDDPAESSDLDGDGVGDNADPDRDGDGVDNDVDAFPDDPGESSDLDGDGLGDNADPDRDGDGVDNASDAFPDDPAESSDLDGDGVGDNADPDRDGDGVDNASDAFPDDPSESSDLDGDGVGDNADPDRDGDGVSNDDEIAAGTDPDDPADFPATVIGLTVDGEPERTIVGDQVALTGTVNAAFTGTITATSDRFPGVDFAAIVTSPGVFSVEVMLLRGANAVTVTAADGTDSASVDVLITSIAAPEIVIDSPRDNSVVEDEVISVTGRIVDASTVGAPLVRIQNKSVDATPSATAGEFDFVIDNVLLAEGLNLLTVEAFSDVLSSSTTLTVTLDTDEAPAPPPQITVTSPVINSFLGADSFELVGTVVSSTGLPQLTINDVPVGLTGTGLTGSFRELFSFGGASQVVLELEAVDGAGRTSSLTVTYNFDQTAPVLQVDGGILPAPAVTTVSQNPFPLTGTVTDANLASVTINDQPVSVEPLGSGVFAFALQLALTTTEALPVEISVADLAGNSQTQTYLLQTDTIQFVEPLLPADGSEFVSSNGQTISVQVAARVSELLGGQQVLARISPNPQSIPPVLLDVAADIASGEVVLPGVAGDYDIVFEISNAAGEAIASGSRGVQVVTLELADLAVSKVEPFNEETGVEPNQFVSVYFNRPIDPALLTIELSETAHGLSYVPGDEPGTDALFAKGQVLDEINRDREPVPGSLSILPGERIVAFYPGRDLAYGAQIYGTVTYDGAELFRWTYRNRSLPTFIIGGVVDQLQQTGAGIDVRLVELDRTTTTNEDGGFAFGFGESAEQNIPGGRYRLELNPGMAQPDYGTVTHWITVQEGRRNDIGLKRIPLLNTEVGFRLIDSGDADVVLAGGEVKLDLSDATLIFPDSRTRGAVHVQFNSTSQIAYDASELALPHWMFSFQPGGITITGEVGVDLALPELFGTTDYIPAEAPYVLMMAVDDASNLVTPVGVGVAAAGRVTSVGKLPLTRLDYIGIAMVLPEQQALLGAFADGEMTLQQLLAELSAAP